MDRSAMSARAEAMEEDTATQPSSNMNIGETTASKPSTVSFCFISLSQELI